MNRLLKDNLEKISDDFQSTFTLVSDYQLMNFLHGEKDFPEVISILKKHLGEVEVEFKKMDKMPREYDVYLISISNVKK